MGVREMRPGDPLRAVHWRSTARVGSLVVREFEQERSSRIGIVIAGRDRGEGPRSSYESLISAAASIGLYALANRHSIHVVAPAEDGVAYLPDPSADTLLDWLATLEAADARIEPLVEHALDRVGRTGTIVICGSSEGDAGRSVRGGVVQAERAGGRACVVLAHASTWDPRVRDEVEASGDLGPRTPLRLIEKDMELATCLAG